MNFAARLLDGAHGPNAIPRTPVPFFVLGDWGYVGALLHQQPEDPQTSRIGASLCSNTRAICEG